jgi:hypothetical protein
MNNLSLALQISFVGISLVFGSILLLWGVMTVLVRLTGERPAAAVEADGAHDEAGTPDPEAELEHARRTAAAAAAVAVALAQRITVVRPPAHLSPWQEVMRANHLRSKRPAR